MSGLANNRSRRPLGRPAVALDRGISHLSELRGIVQARRRLLVAGAVNFVQYLERLFPAEACFSLSRQLFPAFFRLAGKVRQKLEHIAPCFWQAGASFWGISWTTWSDGLGEVEVGSESLLHF
jgi:hypothetical protein